MKSKFASSFMAALFILTTMGPKLSFADGTESDSSSSGTSTGGTSDTGTTGLNKSTKLSEDGLRLTIMSSKIGVYYVLHNLQLTQLMMSRDHSDTVFSAILADLFDTEYNAFKALDEAKPILVTEGLSKCKGKNYGGGDLAASSYDFPKVKFYKDCLIEGLDSEGFERKLIAVFIHEIYHGIKLKQRSGEKLVEGSTLQKEEEKTALVLQNWVYGLIRSDLLSFIERERPVLQRSMKALIDKLQELKKSSDADLIAKFCSIGSLLMQNATELLMNSNSDRQNNGVSFIDQSEFMVIQARLINLSSLCSAGLKKEKGNSEETSKFFSNKNSILASEFLEKYVTNPMPLKRNHVINRLNLASEKNERLIELVKFELAELIKLANENFEILSKKFSTEHEQAAYENELAHPVISSSFFISYLCRNSENKVNIPFMIISAPTEADAIKFADDTFKVSGSSCTLRKTRALTELDWIGKNWAFYNDNLNQMRIESDYITFSTLDCGPDKAIRVRFHYSKSANGSKYIVDKPEETQDGGCNFSKTPPLVEGAEFTLGGTLDGNSNSMGLSLTVSKPREPRSSTYAYVEAR